MQKSCGPHFFLRQNLELSNPECHAQDAARRCPLGHLSSRELMFDGFLLLDLTLVTLFAVTLPVKPT